MPVEPRIIFEAPGCPNPPCEHNKVTISELGCAGMKKKGKIAQGVFTKLAMEVIPIEQPMMAGVTVEAIAVYYDVCAICGTRYCTRAELLQVQVPIQMPGPMPGQGGNPNDFFKKGGRF